MKDKVSIIIPCYNAEKWVGEAIESALLQTYPLKEVIVIDDGSTDRSIEKIRSFGDRIIWRSGRNAGGCAARNMGAELATGEFLQFLDADDLMDPNKIELQIAKLRSGENRQVATCGWQFLGSEGLESPDRKSYWRDFDSGSCMLLEMWHEGGFLSPHTFLISRELFNIVGGWNVSLISDQDGDFFGRVLVEASYVFFTEGTSVAYRRTGGSSITGGRRTPKYWDSKLRAFESVRSALYKKVGEEKAKRSSANRLAKLAYNISNFHPEIAQSVAKKAIELDPSFNRITFAGRGIKWLSLLFGIPMTLQLRSKILKLVRKKHISAIF